MQKANCTQNFPQNPRLVCVGRCYRVVDFLHTDGYIFNGDICYVCSDSLCRSLCTGGDNEDGGGTEQKIKDQ